MYIYMVLNIIVYCMQVFALARITKIGEKLLMHAGMLCYNRQNRQFTQTDTIRSGNLYAQVTREETAACKKAFP